MGYSPSFKLKTASSSIVLTKVDEGDVPIDQETARPSKQSIIGDKYTFPAGMLNSVISVSYLEFGMPAWKSRLTILATSGLISPAYELYFFLFAL